MQEKTWVVKNEMTVLAFLLRYSGQKKKVVMQHIRAKRVLVDGQPVIKADTLLKVGQVVSMPEKMITTQLPFPILYEDDELIAINKPAGLLSIAAGGEKEKTAYHQVSQYLKRQDAKQKVFVLHRLDRDTSGILLFAKNQHIQKALQDNWNELVQERGYLALVEGHLERPSGTLKHILNETKTGLVYVSHHAPGKQAITHYRLLEERSEVSLLEIFLDTGRKNQIRVQMAHIGHPLVGDRKYNPRSAAKRLCLHAHRLVFCHPFSHQSIILETEKPDFFVTFYRK